MSYGKGSPYLDLQLPCGSTLDIYIDQALGTPLVSRLLGMRSRRSLVALRTTLASGSSELASLDTLQDRAQPSQRDGDIFSRVYVPPLKLQLFGADLHNGSCEACNKRWVSGRSGITKRSHTRRVDLCGYQSRAYERRSAA